MKHQMPAVRYEPQAFYLTENVGYYPALEAGTSMCAEYCVPLYG